MRDAETIAREVLKTSEIRNCLPRHHQMVISQEHGGLDDMQTERAENAVETYIRLMTASIEADRKERKEATHA